MPSAPGMRQCRGSAIPAESHPRFTFQNSKHSTRTERSRVALHHRFPMCPRDDVARGPRDRLPHLFRSEPPYTPCCRPQSGCVFPVTYVWAPSPTLQTGLSLGGGPPSTRPGGWSYTKVSAVGCFSSGLACHSQQQASLLTQRGPGPGTPGGFGQPLPSWATGRPVCLLLTLGQKGGLFSKP